MSLKIYLLCTLCLVATTKLLAHEQDIYVGDITVTIKNKMIPSEMSEEKAIAVLKTLGVTTHEQSKITIHEEQNAVDLTCFDCVIEHVGRGAILRASLNERTGE